MWNYELAWRRIGDGAELLKVSGMTAEVRLPGEIAGLPLTEIGAYCFSDRAGLPEHYEVSRASSSDGLEAESGAGREHALEAESGAERERALEAESGAEREHALEAESGNAASSFLRELSGGYIEMLVLPDSVRKIGRLAFYNCVSLRVLEFGSGLTEIGSDTFMNCKNLHHLVVRGGSGAPGGVRQMLAMLPSDIEVTFLGPRGIEAAVLFPEYYESYDEIAPAHLFGRNIEGEGFRARQCFRDGKLDFPQYDAIFPKACAEESEHTLCVLALNRLRYPVDLKDDAKMRYEAYIRAHVGAVFAAAVKTRDLQCTLFLCEQGLCGRKDVEKSVRTAAEADWAEGAAWLLRLLERFFPQKPVGSRYEFDTF